MRTISRLRQLLSLAFVLEPTTTLAVIAVASALATTGTAIAQAQKKPPKPPEVEALPPEAATSPEAAPIQEQETLLTAPQAARKASARARTGVNNNQTILTGRLGSSQSPANVRKPILG